MNVQLMPKFESPHFAAVDLGSNSFHMVICRLNQQTLEIIDREKEMVQIARGMQNGQLAEDAKERALQCLRRFAERLRAIPNAQIRAVGTKSLRTAKQTQSFLLDAEQILGVPIAIISGYEEARLVYQGFAHSVASDHRRRLVIDIGGGSTEFIIGLDLEPELLESLNLGCVTFTENFGLDKKITEKAMGDAYLEAAQQLEILRQNYLKCGWEVAFGTSGTVRAIADLLAPLDGGTLIRASSLRELCKNLLENPDKVLSGIPKLRRDVLPAGIAILRAIFDQLKLEVLQIADATLKEGLIYDTLGRLSDMDARHIAVKKLQRQYNVDTLQAERVANLAHHFWQHVHGPTIPGVSRTKILRWAALLHEVGLGISHSDYHHHGYYILFNSDLAGFGRYEQQLLAYLVRAHRKKLRPDRFDGLDAKTQIAIKPMLVCLRLAVILNRSRETQPIKFDLEHNEQNYHLMTASHWAHDNPLSYAGILNEVNYLNEIGLNLHLT